MLSNSINDKYSIPFIHNIKTRFNNNRFLNFNIFWYSNNGDPIINGNSLILHEDTSDEVIGILKDPVAINNINLNGCYFQCTLPEFNTDDNNVLTILNNDYGIELHNGNILITSADITNQVSYAPGDLYQQIFDGVNVKYYLNGILINSQSILNSPTDSQFGMFINLSAPNSLANTYTINNIYGYVTGKNGTNGADGENGINMLSGSGVPSNTLGLTGEYYTDILTNVIYGPKTDSWVSVKPVDPTSRIITLAYQGTTRLWNFADGYEHILIYLVFAESSTYRQPNEIVQISVHKHSSGPKYFVSGTLPDYIDYESNPDVHRYIEITTDSQSIYLHSVDYGTLNYIGLKIQAIA